MVLEWKPSGIAPLVHQVGEGADRRVYETSELICTGELQEEGAAMRHCVATYWDLCATGQSSIWSMTVEDASGRVERLLTLEVRNGERMIVQARGRRTGSQPVRNCASSPSGASRAVLRSADGFAPSPPSTSPSTEDDRGRFYGPDSGAARSSPTVAAGSGRGW